MIDVSTSDGELIVFTYRIIFDSIESNQEPARSPSFVLSQSGIGTYSTSIALYLLLPSCRFVNEYYSRSAFAVKSTVCKL